MVLSLGRAARERADAHRLLVGPGAVTVGEGGTPVNVQDCRISVGDCDWLWQALPVKAPKRLADRPVVLVVD